MFYTVNKQVIKIVKKRSFRQIIRTLEKQILLQQFQNRKQ